MSATVSPMGEIHDVKRDKFVMVRISIDEQQAWQAAADADKRKLADWIRIACNERIESAKPRKARRS